MVKSNNNEGAEMLPHKSNTMKTQKLSEDKIRDVAIRIVDRLVKEKLIKDCIDTDDDTEFEFQDAIQEELMEVFKIETQYNEQLERKLLFTTNKEKL